MIPLVCKNHAEYFATHKRQLVDASNNTYIIKRELLGTCAIKNAI